MNIIIIILLVILAVMQVVGFLLLYKMNPELKDLIVVVAEAFVNIGKATEQHILEINNPLGDIKKDIESIKKDLEYIPNKINDDYLRIAEETWRLHNRITKLEMDKHIIQKDLLNITPNHKRVTLGLDPIESCDKPYVEGLEFVEDEEVFK